MNKGMADINLDEILKDFRGKEIWIMDGEERKDLTMRDCIAMGLTEPRIKQVSSKDASVRSYLAGKILTTEEKTISLSYDARVKINRAIGEIWGNNIAVQAAANKLLQLDEEKEYTFDELE
jgi:hypothetical protein